MNRREFIRNATGFSGAMMTPGFADGLEPGKTAVPTARVALVKTMDRSAGVSRAIELLELGRFSGKDVFVKPNFNSADKPPGSTHEDTLAALLKLKKAPEPIVILIAGAVGLIVAIPAVILYNVFTRAVKGRLGRSQSLANLVLARATGETAHVAPREVRPVESLGA